MFIYGDLTPRMADPLGHIDRLATEHDVIGVKLYPLDMVDGELVENRLDDEKLMFPLLERLRARGIKVVAVHKAVPLAPTLVDRFHVDDLAPAIAAFPDLTFEIVHGGFAFNNEIAALLGKYANVTVNLEGAPCYALNFADQFADMMTPLLANGPDRIFYSAGVPIMHPQPFIRAFREYEMPRGYAPLTEEMKRGILGENFARMHGWDIEALKQQCAADQFGLTTRENTPWSVVRARELDRVA